MPDEQTPVEKLLSTYDEDRRKEREAIELAVSQTVVAVTKSDQRIDKIISRVIDRHTCPSLYVEWTINRFWGLQVPAMLEDLNKIHAECVRRGLTEEVNHDFNDGDDRIFFLPSPHYKVIVHTGQNLNFIYIWDNYKVHVRQFYDELKTPDDKWEIEEVERFKKETQENGYKAAVKNAEHFSKRYADDFPDNPYPKRHGLDHYKRNGYEVQYGDFRDSGYVLTWDDFVKEVENAMVSHDLIKHVAECFLPCILCELFDGTPDAVSANRTASEKEFDTMADRRTPAVKEKEPSGKEGPVTPDQVG